MLRTVYTPPTDYMISLGLKLGVEAVVEVNTDNTYRYVKDNGVNVIIPIWRFDQRFEGAEPFHTKMLDSNDNDDEFEFLYATNHERYAHRCKVTVCNVDRKAYTPVKLVAEFTDGEKLECTGDDIVARINPCNAESFRRTLFNGRGLSVLKAGETYDVVSKTDRAYEVYSPDRPAIQVRKWRFSMSLRDIVPTSIKLNCNVIVITDKLFNGESLYLKRGIYRKCVNKNTIGVDIGGVMHEMRRLDVIANNTQQPSKAKDAQNVARKPLCPEVPYTPVTMYRTFDGVIHESSVAAERHASKQETHKNINTFIDSLFASGYTHKTVNLIKQNIKAELKL